MLPIDRLVRSALVTLGACVVLAVACYEVPEVRDYYTCKEDAECGDGGFVCDDGVCCREQEDPICLGRVRDGGTCLDGGRPLTFYEDLDEDGFGNLTRPLYRCAPPLSVPTATNGEDCNDNPTVGGRLFFPGAPEQCDGFDNSCEGVIDEGLDGGLYYLDEDNDGFGDPARTGTFCQRPIGWADNRNDCSPNNGAVYPGALEVCNTLDDDCNGATDDTAQVGLACTVPNKLGVCAQGARACVSGKDVCSQVNNPAPLDTCNSKDDDCDGTTDEKPDCGGPIRFAADPSVVFGARHLGSALQGVTGECLKDSSLPNASPADTVTNNDVWTGSGSTSHVFWVERDGGTWDLSRPLTTLKLFVDVASDAGTGTNTDGGLNRWSQHRQPVVLLCGPGGFLRLVPASPILDSATTEQIRKNIPLPPLTDGGGEWIVGSNSSPDVQGVLRQVKRIELLVQPYGASGSFSADFHADFGLP
ncbi:putative metal-binding motif-containing protein [Archangium lansingense]|uniref:Metal-binding motif-containing protein n=1 Tax=Archangium lansingense TaxID=2995310 RepID=A0ABT3ZVT8_9BACT|nr:putative metal-binding motif-containing protein [Archangium lansinium]MCY1073471.1 putative metal-binding motif-containing protein [Archangium lansinium]